MSISPPRARGPSLNAMRAFEAAARHGSFTVAANELCVTPGAVAQQVKSLEAWCGARLFKRQAHGISLTPLGAAVLPVFVNAFDGLGDQKLLDRSRRIRSAFCGHRTGAGKCYDCDKDGQRGESFHGLCPQIEMLRLIYA